VTSAGTADYKLQLVPGHVEWVSGETGQKIWHTHRNQPDRTGLVKILSPFAPKELPASELIG